MIINWIIKLRKQFISNKLIELILQQIVSLREDYFIRFVLMLIVGTDCKSELSIKLYRKVRRLCAPNVFIDKIDMNEYLVLIGLAISLIAYLLFFKERLIKWEERSNVEKSFSIRLLIILISGIILLSIKIFS